MNRFLSIIGCLLMLSGALFSTGCNTLPKAVTPAVCPDCGQRVCRGCKHAPDPYTAGYHCTIWVPMCDPCPQAPIIQAPESLEQGAAQPTNPDAPPDYYMPEPLPPNDSDSR